MKTIMMDKIREAADIIVLASEFTALRRKGKKHIGRSCPFCKANDSFTIDSEKQLFHCFSCGQGGDIFTFVMEKLSLSFPEACRRLAKMFKVDIEEEEKTDKGYTKDQRDVITATLKKLSGTVNECINTLNDMEEDEEEEGIKENPYDTERLKKVVDKEDLPF